MAKRLSHEEFEKTLKEIHPNIELLEEYQNSTTKIKYKCNIDNYEGEAIPRMLVVYGCPVCSGRVITTDIYKKRLKEVHGDDIIFVDEYKKMTAKSLHHCNIHNCDFMTTPMTMLRGSGCKYCGKDKLREAALISKDVAIKRLYDMYGDEITLVDEYHGVSETHKFMHKIDGTSHIFETTFTLLYLGEKCPYCANRKVLVGFNDIATTNPYAASLFKNKEETHLYVELSNQEVDFVCPNCGETVRRKICDVSKNGHVFCPRCSDGISYPNKFIFNILKQVENDLDVLDREYRPDWCKFELNGKQHTGTYDIYFIKNGKEYIVEMDGGFHKTVHSKSSIKLDEIVQIDKIKTKLSHDNSVKIIRIDCAYPRLSDRYEFIKNNIIESDLKDIIDFSKVSFDKANIDSLQSLFIKSCELWRSGLSVQDIANKISLSPETVRTYLESGTEYDICNYSKEENKYRSKTTRAVVCLNTKIIYPSIVKAASEECYIVGGIQACCSGYAAYTINKTTGVRSVWAYLDDYKKMNDYDIYRKILNSYDKKVVCTSKSYLFPTVKEASEWGGVSPSAISKCCTGDSKTSGKDPDTGKPLRWIYYKDYIKNFDESTLLPQGILGAYFNAIKEGGEIFAI